MKPETLIGHPFDFATLALEVGTAVAGLVVAVLAWRALNRWRRR